MVHLKSIVSLVVAAVSTFPCKGLVLKPQSHIGISHSVTPSTSLRAFSIPKSKSTTTWNPHRISQQRGGWNMPFIMTSTSSSSSTQLQMYNLPPENNNNNNNNPLTDILPGILTIVGTILFFMSPLGGIFFAIANSFLLLAFLTPVVLFTGFQIWLKLNTVQGACPNCSYSPIVVSKDTENAQPTICINCGSFVRLARDGENLELCNDGSGIGSMMQEPGGLGEGDLFWDLFGDRSGGDSGAGAGAGPAVSAKDQQKKRERETKVIDIDVIEDK